MNALSKALNEVEELLEEKNKSSIRLMAEQNLRLELATKWQGLVTAMQTISAHADRSAHIRKIANEALVVYGPRVIRIPESDTETVDAAFAPFAALTAFNVAKKAADVEYAASAFTLVDRSIRAASYRLARANFSDALNNETEEAE